MLAALHAELDSIAKTPKLVRLFCVEQAKALGLINTAVPEDTSEEETLKPAQIVAGKLGQAVKIIKQKFQE